MVRFIYRSFPCCKICSAVGLTQWITFIYYIAAGIFLSKKVLVNLITWDGTIHNTIDNVSGAKLGLHYFDNSIPSPFI